MEIKFEKKNKSTWMDLEILKELGVLTERLGKVGRKPKSKKLAKEEKGKGEKEEITEEENAKTSEQIGTPTKVKEERKNPPLMEWPIEGLEPYCGKVDISLWDSFAIQNTSLAKYNL